MKTITNWVECKLKDFIILKNGYAFDSKIYQEQGVPVVRISNITQDNKVLLDNIVCVQDDAEYQKFVISKGDLLLAMSGATTGKLGVYLQDIKVFQNQRIGNLKILNHNVCIPEFRNYLFFSLKDTILHIAYGGAQPNISGTKLLNLPCRLPPVAEQKRIVKKIEELFSVIDTQVKQLEQTQKDLNTYRQSVLKKAFTNLTYKEIILEDIIDYKQPTPYIVKSTDYMESGDIPVLTAGKTFILGYTKEKEGIFKAPLPVIIFDDFTTATKLVNFPFKVKSSAMKILLPKDNVDIKFIFYFLQTISFNANTHKRYWISVCAKTKINLPPLTEQKAIVEKIETAFKAADKVQNAITNALHQAKQLKQSILKRAFEGKLVPQDPNDKPVDLSQLKKEKHK